VTPVLIRTVHHQSHATNAFSVENPVGTITSANGHAVVAPVLVGAGGPGYSGKPTSADAPIGTVMVENHRALASAFIAKHFGGVVGHGPERPIGTVTSKDHHSVVAANMIHMNHGEKQWSGCDEPTRTQTTANHAGLVYAFLTKYFSTNIGHAADQPLQTVTSRDRFGLVTVNVGGEPYVIVDIGLRMLTPRELARAQGFPDSYVLTGTKSSQVARIGNSVCPVMAEALVRANCPDLAFKLKRPRRKREVAHA
jgi:DNA (cytosine-5)-methyltransferase 1